MAIRGNRVRNWVCNIIAAAVPAAVAAIGVAAIAARLLNTLGVTDGPPLDDTSDWIYFVVVTCGATGFFAVVTIRALARSVDVSEAGLKARYAFRTKRIPWSDINALQIRHVENDEGPGRYKVQYERFDGKHRSLPIGTSSRTAANKAFTWLKEQRRILDRSKA